MNARTPSRIAAIGLADGALAGIGATTAASGPSGIHIRAGLKVTAGPPPACTAGLHCPQPGVGARVTAVWAVDGADSTGTFAGATWERRTCRRQVESIVMIGSRSPASASTTRHSHPSDPHRAILTDTRRRA